MPSRGGPTTLDQVRLNTAIMSPPSKQAIGRDLPRELLIIDVDLPRTAELRLPTTGPGPPTTGLHLLEGATNIDRLPAIIHITGQSAPRAWAMEMTTDVLETIIGDA